MLQVNPKLRPSANTLVKICSKHTQSNDVYSLDYISDDDRFGTLASGGDYSIKKCDTQTGDVLLTMLGHTGYVSTIKAFQNRIFSGSWDSTIRQY